MSTTANMETLTRQIILAGFVLMFSSPITLGQPIRISDGPVFDKVILPILQEKCMSCHGPDKAKGKLRLHSREFIEAADGLIE
ncbi:MAG: c-type cytochrome domain-containing protein, partial [Opitutae bacterium]